MNDMRIVLASASPRRSELLKKSGIIPEVMPSDTDENIHLNDPEELVSELSDRKCSDIASGLIKDGSSPMRNTAVIGADTVVAAEGRILGKPADEEDAARMLRMLSGKPHEVLTGVCMILISGGKIIKKEKFTEISKVRVIDMTEEEIKEYISTGEPLDKAGAYGIQGYFARYVEGIEGDYSNIVGLPVCRVYQTLRGFVDELQ